MFNIITHHRFFHTDEVMAVALLDLFMLNGKYNLIRTRDNKIIKKHQNDLNSFVIDVGLQYNENKLNFDHHQNDKNLCWNDKTPYSSCGLIWQYLKNNNILNIDQNKILFIEETVIKNVDKQDNGVGKWLDGFIITMYNRNHHDDKILDKQFLKAVNACKDYIINIINYDQKNTKQAFTISNGIFIALLNTYLKEVNYDIVDNNGQLNIVVSDYGNIKQQELFEKAINTFDCVDLFNYLDKSNVYTQYMNKTVFSEFKNGCLEVINNEDKAMFIKLYQFNKNNNLLTQFKKSLKVTQDFVFNVFTKIKNEIKANKDIQKCVDKSKHLKDIVVLDSNIKEAPTYVAKHTDKKVLIIPRTKNSWKIQAVPLSYDKPFSKRVHMPKKWCGLGEYKIKQASGINGLIFCHKEGFMCMFEGSIEETINLVEKYII